jgi:tetratricopeptide (TPR) repeat protein
MFRCALAAFVVVLFGAAPAFAQLDAEPKQPYLWRVVLSAKPHPLITPDFRDRLKRDIVAGLQTGLGNLGTVEVLDLAEIPRDKRDPLLEQFDEKGFPALGAPRDLTGAKTHFLRIEYRDGKFLLETRQYDGFTGLSSPLVRAQSVRAPEQVGRTAGLMLDRDFGLAGTVEPIAGRADEVKVLVRGSALGPVDGLVQRGDIFALAAVRKTNRPAPAPVRTATGKIIAPPPGSVPPPGFTSTPRDFTLLKVAEVLADGSLRATVLTRYQTAMPTAGVAGYRCMKLGTVKAPVAVRLMNTDGVVYKTASTVTVRASDVGFPNPAMPDPKEAQKEVCRFQKDTAQFRSDRALNGVACITVSLGPSQSKQFPVPLLSEAPITIPFDVDPAKEERAAFERSVLAAASKAADARQAQTTCFAEVAKLIDKQKNKEALERAVGGFKSAEEADQSGTDELTRLREQSKTVQGGGNADPILAKIEQNIAALRTYNAQLKGHIAKIEEVVKRENDPAVAAKDVQAQALNARITLLLGGGEVEQALAAYDQLIALVPENEDIKTRREKLAAEWKVKDDAHQKARDYLLKTWPAVATIQDFKDSLPVLRSSVDVCKKHGDKWTLRKLLTSFSTAGVKLNDLVTPLDPASETDRKLLADANNAGKVLAALEVELRTFVGE